MTAAVATRTPLIERVISSLNDFPMARAAVIPKVMELTANADAAPGDLARVISNDPGLSAAVLRLSNSSFYGRVCAVSSLREAVMVLGVSLLRSLIIATSVSSLFKSKEDELEESLWRHSLATAIGARLIARHTRMGAEEEVFLTGLVQDLAQLILLQRFPDEYRPVMTEIRQSWAQQLEIERDRLGTTHEELGAIILEEWKFPPHLISVIGHHHEPDADVGDPGVINADMVRRMRHVVYAADLLANSLGHGFHGGVEVDRALVSSMEFLQLEPDAIPDISEELAVSFAEENELFKG